LISASNALISSIFASIYASRSAMTSSSVSISFFTFASLFCNSSSSYLYFSISAKVSSFSSFNIAIYSSILLSYLIYSFYCPYYFLDTSLYISFIFSNLVNPFLLNSMCYWISTLSPFMIYASPLFT
jgi:hypothetical protein